MPVRVLGSVLSAILLMVLAATPAYAHGTSSRTVSEPDFGTEISGTARMDVDPNHYRLTIKVELQERPAGTSTWSTVATATNEKIESGFIKATATADTTFCGTRFSEDFRTRLVFARAFNQNGDLVHSYNNVYSSILNNAPCTTI